ncbi:hypothetical protein GSI_08034 [Ganoderma sinense ZZ0214-1]|uniref:Uncharacterized protein n=1 Tax=Ganoderma sinense ZZ0214-1 TaxID=1077348 RepID=A0A2G8S7W9_9APHY|nr:hypothetical protein GSI_08034 [Ganoderma sinense ZZ0214-1]
MSSPTADSLNLFASESTFSSSSVESVCGSVFDMPRTLSSGTEGCSSIFEHASSSEDGFSVYSGEDTNLVFSDPFADDAVEVLKSPSNAGTNTSLRQRLSSSGSRRSSMGSATSSVLKDDVEAGYEADSDARTTASRRSSAHRRRARSRRGSATVHYLVERVEPTIEVLAPVTPEELAYLKAHTNIPIPAHYQALLPKDAEWDVPADAPNPSLLCGGSTSSQSSNVSASQTSAAALTL